MQRERLRLLAGATTVAAAFTLLSASGAHGEGRRSYSGMPANQVLDALYNGGAWCEPTTRVLDPSTGAVLQAWCQCVSQVLITAGDRGTENFAIQVEMGPETQCAPAGATAQQQAAAQQEMAQIDAQLAQWHSYLQNLGRQCDAWGYNNDANYRAQCDAWMQQEGARGGWYITQLQGRRTALDTMLRTGGVPTAPAIPAGGGPTAAPSGGGGQSVPSGTSGGGPGGGTAPPMPRDIPHMEDINRGGG